MDEHRRADLNEIRAFFAKMMATASGSTDARLERIFELVPREAFLGPGPWKIRVNRSYVETPSADPSYLYNNVLVALDGAKGINNGEPFLHAAWIGRIAPQPGESVVHIGTGTGYYTAVLAMLVLPNGTVHGFEIEKDIADRARANLEPFEGISIVDADAAAQALPAADIIYINAGVGSLPGHWLTALKPGGRLIFPWQATERHGVTMLVTRTAAGYATRALMPSWFIPCVGTQDPAFCLRAPDTSQIAGIRSAWLNAEAPPDDSAVAVYKDIWFSRAETTKN